jgi:hypothetical protein
MNFSNLSLSESQPWFWQRHAKFVGVGRAVPWMSNLWSNSRCSRLGVWNLISWVRLYLSFTKSWFFAIVQKWGPTLQSRRRGHASLCSTWWTFQMWLVWITVVSPTTLIPISAYSVLNFNTVIHSNGKKRCSLEFEATENYPQWDALHCI